MGQALKADEALSNPESVADGIFASLEALKRIAMAANLPEIYIKIDTLLSSSLEAHVDKLRSQLEAMHKHK